MKPLYQTVAFHFVKNGFIKGEYSVYRYVYGMGKKDIRSSVYLFGVSRLYQAKNICLFLNKSLKEGL